MARPMQATVVWAVTLVSVALSLAAPTVASPVLDVVAVVAILLLGLPHGALDLLDLKAERDISAGSAVILATYLAVLAVTGLVWWADASLALTIFLVLSVVHFAIEWGGRLPKLAAAAAATLVISVPAVAWPGEVSHLFATLSGDEVVAKMLTTLAGAAALPVAGLLAIVLLRHHADRGEICILLALGVAGTMLKPLHAFAIFFALVHSPRHLEETAIRHGWSFAEATRRALPLTGLSLLGFVALLWRFNWSHLAASAFLLLAILAVPHLFSAPLLRFLPRQSLTCSAETPPV